MTRQLRRKKDSAARNRRRVTKLIRVGTGHITGSDKRAMRLAGRTERIARADLQRDMLAQLQEAAATD